MTDKNFQTRILKRKKICGKLHPTSMHIKTMTTGIVRDVSIAMSIVPVLISHKDHPELEVETYAVIDNCSQGTFATEDILLNRLGLSGRSTSITLETANSTETVPTTVVEGLIIRCRNENKQQYPDSPNINLPSTFTRLYLPDSTSGIASRQRAKEWKHLESIVNVMPPLDRELSIGLLIGQDCPRAQEPYQIQRRDGQGLI